MHGQIGDELLLGGAVIILSKDGIVEVVYHAIICRLVPANLLLINLVVHAHLRLLHHLSCHFFEDGRDRDQEVNSQLEVLVLE